MANFATPSVHDVETIKAEARDLSDAAHPDLSVLRLYFTDAHGTAMLPIFGAGQFDKFERVAAAINEIFAEPK